MVQRKFTTIINGLDYYEPTVLLQNLNLLVFNIALVMYKEKQSSSKLKV